ncbi:MAG: (Fe-S)-binding protein [Ignisphaera sp.]|nr:(Fe-S)-binding protein [Ignisphaera sp.]MDW8085578.1 (Fe-S)-binding protein [Ignisphaera sp.]
MEHQKVVFYRGCTLRNISQDAVSKIQYIFEKAGIDLVIIDDEGCCGYPLLLAGYREQFRRCASSVAEKLTSVDHSLIVTHCPGCLRMFTQLYPRNGLRSLKALHTTQFLLQLIRGGALKLEKSVDLRAAYHDPCDLGRHLGVYAEPREVVKTVPGVSLIELPEVSVGRYSRCCGGGGLLRLVVPPLASQIAIDRIAEDVAGLDVQALITACPTCTRTLRDAASVVESIYGASIKVLDVVELVYNSLV